MATLLLVRHGETTANASGLLAGRSPGVRLNDRGEEQARLLGRRLAAVPVTRAVLSPMERCAQTYQVIRTAAGWDLDAETDERLNEVDFGAWQGRRLRDLAKDPDWALVQNQPSAVIFPGGESLRDVSARAVAAVREQDAAVAAAHGDDALWLAIAHGDVIKTILADALGMHLDQFQRIVVAPCSLSVINYSAQRPHVLRMGETLEAASLQPKQAARSGGAIGGGV
ncbi:MSMEG_4193 family putative phosphomutase [Saxibacter everestensis]|uniref:MSMEG_4193 family putative phosphomutase n=1 Tax=Saxibacter everestensis TaxID=2909229 RepID=A0ABY8QXD6_9MICO|nr:MSMEG_4193 family putative phosphomutase [Brevibacteriaceae bacterium ZFBP1038]